MRRAPSNLPGPDSRASGSSRPRRPRRRRRRRSSSSSSSSSRSSRHVSCAEPEDGGIELLQVFAIPKTRVRDSARSETPMHCSFF